MDDAELWLKANDPAYTKTSEGWRHVNDENYHGEVKENPAGGTNELALFGESIHATDLGEKVCKACYSLFAPRKCDHDLCSTACRENDRRRYMRDLMRQRRQAA